METTLDQLLGGRMQLRQPAQGYRAAIDPVLLAAAVDAQPGQRVLDLGVGTGAAALCLAARVRECSLVGLEVQPELAQLAQDNAILNRCADRLSIRVGDVVHGAGAENSAFDHVMANPPYGEAGRRGSPVAAKAIANVESTASLADWIAQAFAAVAAGGTVTFIHRADRLAELVAGFAAQAGEVVVFPLWPRPGADARRVLVRGRRGSRAPLRLAAGLVLHQPDGGYTAAANAILREGSKLEL